MPRGQGIRWVAIAGLILATLFIVISTARTWMLTSGAALGWRLRVLLPDAIGGSLVAAGFVLAAFGSPRLRRVGWCAVGLVLLGTLAWTALVIFE